MSYGHRVHWQTPVLNVTIDYNRVKSTCEMNTTKVWFRQHCAVVTVFMMSDLQQRQSVFGSLNPLLVYLFAYTIYCVR